MSLIWFLEPNYFADSDSSIISIFNWTGTMQVLEARHSELFLMDDWNKSGLSFKTIGRREISWTCAKAAAAIFDQEQISDPASQDVLDTKSWSGSKGDWQPRWYILFLFLSHNVCFDRPLFGLPTPHTFRLTIPLDCRHVHLCFRGIVAKTATAICTNLQPNEGMKLWQICSTHADSKIFPHFTTLWLRRCQNSSLAVYALAGISITCDTLQAGEKGTILAIRVAQQLLWPCRLFTSAATKLRITSSKIGVHRPPRVLLWSGAMLMLKVCRHRCVEVFWNLTCYICHDIILKLCRHSLAEIIVQYTSVRHC